VNKSCIVVFICNIATSPLQHNIIWKQIGTWEEVMRGNFELIKSGELQYLTIPAFTATGLVTHAISTRKGGVSTGDYSTLNLGLGKNDGRKNVLENRRRFLQALDLDLALLVAGRQNHGSRVAVVTEKERGRGNCSYDKGLPGIDAMVTDRQGVVLSIYFADCVPLLFLDPLGRAIGVAHAGWRGTLAGIGPKTLACMQREYGTEVPHCLAGIGPSIGPCCYEVGQQVLGPLRRFFPDWRTYVVPIGGGKYYLDLWELNRQQLLAAGVREKNIFIGNLCTACNEKMFFSYRAHGGHTGSLAAVLTLK